MSSSTTKTAYSSSTTASGVYSSTTPTGVKNVTIQTYSSATPQGKEVIVQTQEKGVVDTRVDDAKEMIIDRLKEFVSDKVQLGVSYNLVEVPLFLGNGFAKFSADVEFHECDDDTIASVCAEIDPSVTELENLFEQELSIEFFKGASLSLGKENFAICLEKDGLSVEVNLAEIKNRKLSMTASKSIEIGEQATLTLSLEVEKTIPESNDTNDDENGIWDDVCEFAEEQIVRIGENNSAVLEWGAENWKEIAITIGAIVLTAVGAPIAATAGTALGTASLATLISGLFGNEPEMSEIEENETEQFDVEVR